MLSRHLILFRNLARDAVVVVPEGVDACASGFHTTYRASAAVPVYRRSNVEVAADIIQQSEFDAYERRPVDLHG